MNWVEIIWASDWTCSMDVPDTQEYTVILGAMLLRTPCCFDSGIRYIANHFQTQMNLSVTESNYSLNYTFLDFAEN